MKYAINREHYKKFPLFEENKREGRAYFIPYSSRETLAATPFLEERYQSDRVMVLSGEWDFHYYDQVSKLPQTLDTDAELFDRIQVPSDWQRTGYEPPFYVNQRYQFPCKPPKIPTDIPVGVYRKKFALETLDDHYILTFLGAISSLDVYINGRYVGYSEGAHNSAEFDVRPFLQQGENELVAVVFKYSNGTYLECQDMFRENGIFRDVLLTRCASTYLNDYQLKTKKTGNTYSLSGEVELAGEPAGHTVQITLMDGASMLSTQEITAQQRTAFSFRNLSVREWSAEIPTVYETYITLKKDGVPVESLRNFTGFRSVVIKKDVFTFNGKAIKLKGVNHHDTSLKGYVMDAEDLLRDVKLMKRLNVNAVRTSHYPPDPVFLTLCDLYGLYVVDEADIETHGTCCDPIYRPNRISNNKKWVNHYLDRIKRMYLRDRNHPCIVLWSLGNEAGGWKNQDACCEYLHRVCPEIPVHYEGVIRTRRIAYDVISEMYPHVDHVREIGERREKKKLGEKPFFLCEYAHAMGVGPGGLQEYWDTVLSSDRLMGGCIWEWADHAVLQPEGSKYRYTYGGDHGEFIHDSNFCVDGLIYPDRTPHTGAYEMQAVYRPVRARVAGEGRYTFSNLNYFRTADYLTVRWELLKDGSSVESGTFRLSAAPQSNETVVLRHASPEAGSDWHMNFTYYNEEEETLAAEQLTLLQAKKLSLAPPAGRTLSAQEEGGSLVIHFDEGEAAFDPKTGRMERYSYRGKALLNPAPASKEVGFFPNIYRAPIDNDMNIRKSWEKCGYDCYTADCKNFRTERKRDRLLIETDLQLRAKEKDLFLIHMAYEFAANGTFTLRVKLDPPFDKKLKAEIARFGLLFEMPEEFRNVAYYGLGEKENLPDFRAQSTMGIFETTVSAMHEDYIRPQDNGNHTGTRWLKLTDEAGAGWMLFREEKDFTFNAHPYTQKLLQKARHREDLYDEHTTAVSVDGFTRGAGTNSCGPEPWKNFVISARDGLEFEISFVPLG